MKRYNQFISTQINGDAAPGFSSGQAMAAMERLAAKSLPKGYAYDWSAMSFQEREAGGKVSILFALALLFGYLFLVGQYESWTIPLPIIIYIPVATMGALTGLWITGFSISIYAQIGLVLLVGLASKNAILIVEFSKDRREEGMSVEKACDGRGTDPLPAGIDDRLYLYSGCNAHVDCHRGRRRQPPGHRHYGVQWHAGSDPCRYFSDSFALLCLSVIPREMQRLARTSADERGIVTVKSL